jgi:hypothetical protein
MYSSDQRQAGRWCGVITTLLLAQVTNGQGKARDFMVHAIDPRSLSSPTEHTTLLYECLEGS